MMTKSYLLLITLVLIQTRPHPESKLYFTDYCTYFQYPSESHQVQTDDGYLLTFFRIQAKNSNITEVSIIIILRDFHLFY